MPNSAARLTVRSPDQASAVAVIARSLRVPFLILTPVCVFLGAAVSKVLSGNIDLRLLALTLVGGLLAHVSVNTLNEYQDFRSGLDFATRRTSFSGGSGALPENPGQARWVLLTAVIALLAMLTVGVMLLDSAGLGLMPFGLVGILLIVTYTRNINRYPLLCLLAPGTGFGMLMVVGTQYVLTGSYPVLAWVAAAVPFFLVNNLLLLNQYPDIQADTVAGRRHIPIAYGIPAANVIYALFLLAAVLVIVVAVLSGLFPGRALLALVPVPLGVYALTGAVRHGKSIARFPRYLAANVAVAILVPLLLALLIITGV